MRFVSQNERTGLPRLINQARWWAQLFCNDLVLAYLNSGHRSQTVMNSLETPLLRVSRPVSACSKCRSAKIKCDGQLPACSACTKAGRSAECSSANDQFAKGKERSYVSSLESRVDKLEKQISQARARRGSVRMADAPPDCSVPTPIARFPTTNPKKERKEASVVDELVSDFGFLSVNATARDFHGFTKQMSFARLVLSTSATDTMPNLEAAALLPQYAITSLVEHYVENIHVFYPFLSETKIFASLDALYHERGNYASSVDRWTVRFVLAIALASQSRQKGDQQYQKAVYYASMALECAETVLQPGSMAGVQSILLLVLYATLDPYHFNSWYLIGVASRAMVDLGLHQDPTTPKQVPSAEADLRRRVFHSVYILDRFGRDQPASFETLTSNRAISMAHHRAFSFTDDSSNVAFPSNQSPFSFSPKSVPEQEPCFIHNIEPSIQLSRLRQLQSSAYQKLFKSSRRRIQDPWQIVSDSLNDMCRWMDCLPSMIDKPIKRLLQCDLLYGSILILSPPGLVGTLNSYGQALLFCYACEYAEIMLSISGEQKNFAFCTSYDLLRVYLVARQLLAIIRDGPALFLDGITPVPPSCSSACLPPPPIPILKSHQALNDAVCCLDRLDEILKHLRVRYGYGSTVRWKEYRNNSKEVKDMLCYRLDGLEKTGGSI